MFSKIESNDDERPSEKLSDVVKKPIYKVEFFLVAALHFHQKRAIKSRQFINEG